MLSPLADPLAAALFIHHRALANPDLVRRLLPVPVAQPSEPEPPHPRLRGTQQRQKEYPKGIPVARLPPMPEDLPPRCPTMAELLAEVAHNHNLTLIAIRARCRKRRIVYARQEFCYRAAAETLNSYPSIARFLGGYDHTTIMHSVASYCERMGLPYPRGSICMGRMLRVKERKARYDAKRRAVA